MRCVFKWTPKPRNCATRPPSARRRWKRVATQPPEIHTHRDTHAQHTHLKALRCREFATISSREKKTKKPHIASCENSRYAKRSLKHDLVCSLRLMWLSWFFRGIKKLLLVWRWMFFCFVLFSFFFNGPLAYVHVAVLTVVYWCSKIWESKRQKKNPTTTTCTRWLFFTHL